MKKTLNYLLFSLALMSVTSCLSKEKKQPDATLTESSIEQPGPQQDLSEYETAYFASGCFWCVEAVYQQLEGVYAAVTRQRLDGRPTSSMHNLSR